jgi:hypothetical protein
MIEAKYDGHILIHNKQGIHKHVATFELSLSGLERHVKCIEFIVSYSHFVYI